MDRNITHERQALIAIPQSRSRPRSVFTSRKHKTAAAKPFTMEMYAVLLLL